MSEQWEDNLETLYRFSRHELPPQQLDQKIRLAAKQAIKSRSVGWKWYLSTAAVVTLALTIVIETQQPDPAIQELPETIVDDASFDQMEPAAPAASEMLQEPASQSAPLPQPAARKKLASPPVILLPSKNTQPLFETQPDELKESDREGVTRMQLKRELAFNTRIPEHIPFDLSLLLDGADELHGYQTEDTIVVYQQDQQILKMIRTKQGINIEASSGASHWGVFAQWGQSRLQFPNCQGSDALVCELDDHIQGRFENNRLVSIYWVQENEP